MNDFGRNENVAESFNPDVKIKQENFYVNISEVYNEGENIENEITENHSVGDFNSSIKMNIKSEYERDFQEDDDDFPVNLRILEPKVGNCYEFKMIKLLSGL